MIGEQRTTAWPARERPVPLATRWGVLACAMIVAAAFAYNAWLLDPRLFFVSDDWAWLWRAEFLPWREYFDLLPASVYNDRPVGAALVKAMYQVFGLDRPRYVFVLLCLHALNCLLLYAFALPYAGRAGATLSGLVAATWFSANLAIQAPSTIFDLLGATFCLATVGLRGAASRSRHGVVFDVAGIVCYVLAIRTKEFALGMAAVIVLMHVVLDRRPLRSALTQAWPYLLVCAIFVARYAQLMAATPPAGDDPYRLVFTVPTVIASLGFFVSTALYEDLIGLTGVAAILGALGLALASSGGSARRIAAFGFAAFVITFGPTLFLITNEHTGYHQLYLYAPHFFLALVVGALLTGRAVPSVLAGGIAIALAFVPVWTHARAYVIEFTLGKSEAIHAEYDEAVRLLAPLERGATVFVTGVEPYFNPFSNTTVNSLKLAFKDRTVAVVVDEPEPALVAKFCATTGAKRFLRYTGTEATEITAEVQRRCASMPPPPG